MLVVVTAGCGRGAEYGEVEGRVLSGGLPLSNIQVRFLPDPETGSDGPEASALTDASGRFRLRTERIRRYGVVVGTHRVCLRPMTVPWKCTLPGGAIPVQRPGYEVGARGLRSLPRCADPATTPFRRVRVRPGHQTYDFDLQKESVVPMR
jgi:hypothetical protein